MDRKPSARQTSAHITVGRRGIVLLVTLIVGVVGGLLVATAAASASTATSTHFPECNSVLEGPQGGSKTATVSSIASDGSVTLHVTATFPSEATTPKPGDHIFDCVFDGTPARDNVVGSTDTPGADCSNTGLPCSFDVTTEPLSAGPHNLCDIAKFEGFGEGPSGRRTPEFCVSVTIPPGSSPSPTPTPTPSGGQGGGAPTPTPQVPGLPNTGTGGSGPSVPILLAVLLTAATGLGGLGAHLIRRRA